MVELVHGAWACLVRAWHRGLECKLPYSSDVSDVWDMDRSKSAYKARMENVNTLRAAKDLDSGQMQGWWRWLVLLQSDTEQLFFFFCDTMVWTQGLVFARQVLYCLSHESSPFCFSQFLDRVLCFCPRWTQTVILLHASHITGIICMIHYCLACLLRH
jgi:hypothetical protein